MPTKEDDFKQRLAAVLEDLHSHGVDDGEAMFLLGSFASRIVADSKSKSWVNLKSRMNMQDYQSMLKMMEARGNTLVKEGKGKAAYAIQALAVSLVARAQKDPVVLQGDKLLDKLIDASIRQYRKHAQQ